MWEEWMNIQLQQRENMRVPNRSHISEDYNNWIEKYTEGFNNRLNEVQEWINDLEDKTMEFTQMEQQKQEKNFKKGR